MPCKNETLFLGFGSHWVSIEKDSENKANFLFCFILFFCFYVFFLVFFCVFLFFGGLGFKKKHNWNGDSLFGVG